jgi:hypothetical protein
VLAAKNNYNKRASNWSGYFPRSSSGLSPEKNPQGAGPVSFDAPTAIWRLPSLVREETKMGMIAFYAGLIIGILLGLLLASLLAFPLGDSQDMELPDQSEAYSQADPQEP